MSVIPDRAARAFPLLLLAALFALAFLLNRMTELPAFNMSGSPSEPDLTIYKFTALGFDVDGHLLYRLTADRMKHYKDESADLDHPHIRRTEAKATPLTVVGDTAHVTNRGDNIFFGQNVVMRDEGDSTRRAVVVRTTKLSVNVPNGEVKTDAPAEAESSGNFLHAVGFEYSNKTGVLHTHTRGSIDYVRPKH